MPSRRLLPLVLLAVLALLCLPLAGAAPAAAPRPVPGRSATPVAATPAAELTARLDALLAGYYPPDAPGAAVLVTKDGKPLLRRGYGMADLELGVPMRPEHVFRLGSVTKQFTAVAILQLVAQGKVALDDDIGKYLPAFPPPERRVPPGRITVENLLTHTSGIKSYTDMDSFQSRMREDLTPEQMNERFQGQPLDFAPGTQWRYSNSGYFLLGEVIARASGLPYGEYLAKNLFAPLGLTHTSYGDTTPLIAQRVPGYSREGDHWVNAPFLSMTQPYAAGSLLSTVDDLARWNEALLAGKAVSPELLRRAWASYHLADGSSSGYGYGWSVGELLGHPTVEHGGGINGFSTYELALPDQKLFVAVLTNSDAPPVDPGFVAAQAASFAMGAPYDPHPVALPAERLQEYVGVYRIDDRTTRAITLEDGRLWSQRSGGPRFEVRPQGEDRFFFERSFAELRFERGADGKVAAVVLSRRPGQPERALRTADQPLVHQAIALDPATLDRYAGRYELAPGFVLEVRHEGAHLMAQATGQATLEIFPQSASEFFVAEVDAQVTFQLGADGVATGLVLHQGGRDIPGKKL
ncbi:MAG TPA: serine hydrolase [Thermoanaerobaculia bacterium]|jgi:CubicO group peptidase (beta-lactamase class C family)|nr:serine hydrolase [Thermoanaerobaculia bacterium]